MLSKLHTFTLKLLTTSKEVGLRRLRSYAASIGGGAELYTDIADVLLSLQDDHLPSIVLVDSPIKISDENISLLRIKAQVMIIDSSDFKTKSPKLGDQIYDVVTYIQGNLVGFLSSPICRINASKLCDQNSKLELATLLRWGHARKTWTPDSAETIAQAGHKFIRDYCLIENWRRTTEMFCHFAECQLKNLAIENIKIDFASDGLMLANVVRCKIKGDIKEAIYKINKELRVYRFPMAAINQISNNDLEIATYFCPVHNDLQPSEPVILIYNQRNTVVELKSSINSDQDPKKWEDAG